MTIEGQKNHYKVKFLKGYFKIFKTLEDVMIL